MADIHPGVFCSDTPVAIHSYSVLLKATTIQTRLPPWERLLAAPVVMNA